MGINCPCITNLFKTGKLLTIQRVNSLAYTYLISTCASWLAFSSKPFIISYLKSSYFWMENKKPNWDGVYRHFLKHFMMSITHQPCNLSIKLLFLAKSQMATCREVWALVLNSWNHRWCNWSVQAFCIIMIDLKSRAICLCITLWIQYREKKECSASDCGKIIIAICISRSALFSKSFCP